MNVREYVTEQINKITRSAPESHHVIISDLEAFDFVPIEIITLYSEHWQLVACSRHSDNLDAIYRLKEK